MQASSIRRGMAIVRSNQIYIVTEFAHRTPGNKRAFMQITMKNLASGQIIQERYAATEDLELAHLDPRKTQFMYRDGEGFHFMDLEDYHTYALNEELIGDSKYFMKDGMEIELLFFQGKSIQVNLPKQVSLKVTESPPGIKGDSVSNNTKVAVLETGLKLNIPIFIEEGTIIRVNTQTGEYLGRE